MKVYISLPITGQELAARAKAVWVKRMLAASGHEPVSPFEVEAGKNPTNLEYLLADLRVLSGCDAVYLCDGWQFSRGCRIEAFWAKEFNKQVMYENK